jgi:hypothetical protein
VGKSDGIILLEKKRIELASAEKDNKKRRVKYLTVHSKRVIVSS